MITITQANFESDVVAASAHTPILLDFWSPTCGPCRVLMPVLEKLEAEYAGRFVLATVNTHEEPALAAMFGVRSVPTVILMMDGRPVNGFVGALPEPQLRSFLDQYLPTVQEMQAIEEDTAAHQALDAGDVDAALDKLASAVATDPDNDDIRFDYVKLLLQQRCDDDAKVAFAPVIARADSSPRLAALQHWMRALDATGADAQAALARADAAIAADRRDFAARLARAQVLMAQQQWTDALDELLEILMRDKGWEDGAARKTFIAILELITPPRPAVTEGQIPPTDPTVETYRRRLSSVILS